MKSPRRLVSFISLLLVIVMVTVSCAAPAATPAPSGTEPTTAPPAEMIRDIPPRPDAPMAPAEEQVLKWDLPGDFWPDAIGIGGWASDMHPFMYAGLTTETIDGTIRGELAESWDVSEDGLTYTFHLKPNAMFSDGTPITAEDVEFSIFSLLDPNGPTDGLYRSPYRSIAGYQELVDGTADSISGIQVIDDQTISFTLTEPLVYFPATLGFWQARIVSKANVEAGGTEWWRDPVTSGMYKVDRFDYGQRNYIELVPNEYYEALGPMPHIQRIIVERITDPGTRLTRYLNGETNVLYYPGTADVAAALQGGELQDELLGNVIAGTFFFYFRHDRPPFDDPKVRQAFIMALDQDLLSASVLDGTLFPLDSLIPRGTECHIEGEYHQLPFDVERAQALLAESSYADEMPVVRIQVSEILGAAAADRWTRTATAMAAMWQENLGVEVKLQTSEFEFEDSQEGAAQVFRSSRSPLVLDGAALTLWFGEGMSTADMIHYDNDEVQQLLAQADQETDPETRCAMYQQADQMLLEDGVFAAAWGIANWAFAKPEVRGISTRTRWQFYLSIPQTYIAETG